MLQLNVMSNEVVSKGAKQNDLSMSTDKNRPSASNHTLHQGFIIIVSLIFLFCYFIIVINQYK